MTMPAANKVANTLFHVLSSLKLDFQFFGFAQFLYRYWYYYNAFPVLWLFVNLVVNFTFFLSLRITFLIFLLSLF